MARPILFAPQNSNLGGSRDGSNYLVQFRAGRMEMRGTTVYPINTKGKCLPFRQTTCTFSRIVVRSRLNIDKNLSFWFLGLVYLQQSSEDGLMHFCWKERETNKVVEDLILFPDDAEFKRVPQCTTGE